MKHQDITIEADAALDNAILQLKEVEEFVSKQNSPDAPILGKEE
jgi:hypothetical protein